jgi:hypothetical protein
MPRLRVVNVLIAVVVCQPVELSTFHHDAMLATSHAIGVVEGFAWVGARIEVGCVARRIAFVVGVGSGGRNDHAGASG